MLGLIIHSNNFILIQNISNFHQNYFINYLEPNFLFKLSLNFKMQADKFTADVIIMIIITIYKNIIKLKK